MNGYLFWRLVHFCGIVVFVAGHGVSAAVTLALPKEHDPLRLETLLGLSRATIVWSNVGLLVLVVGGAANWIRIDYPKQGWLWTAAAVLAMLAAAGIGLAAPYVRRVRAAVPNNDRERLASLQASRLPWRVFWLETLGTAVILWLMVYKPF